MSEHLYSYLDDLLRLQSDAAERHNHKGVLGAVREDFVIQVLNDRIDDIKIHTGEVTTEAGDQGQNDVIIRHRGRLNPELGGQVRIAALDCAGIIEIKSNAKATEITDFDQKAAAIKIDNPDAICGMVCYKIRNRKQTILKRLGFDFDQDIDGFLKSENEEHEYNHLDFILCLDEAEEETGDKEYKKAFFIKKGSDGEYELFIDPPYMQYFLLEVNAAANPEVAA